jgi:hypothetical protein
MELVATPISMRAMEASQPALLVPETLSLTFKNNSVTTVNGSLHVADKNQPHFHLNWTQPSPLPLQTCGARKTTSQMDSGMLVVLPTFTPAMEVFRWGSTARRVCSTTLKTTSAKTENGLQFVVVRNLWPQHQAKWMYPVTQPHQIYSAPNTTWLMESTLLQAASTTSTLAMLALQLESTARPDFSTIRAWLIAPIVN